MKVSKTEIEEIGLKDAYYDELRSKVTKEEGYVIPNHDFTKRDLERAINHLLNCVDKAKGKYQMGRFNVSEETLEAYKVLDLFANFDDEWTIYHP